MRPYVKVRGKLWELDIVDYKKPFWRCLVPEWQAEFPEDSREIWHIHIKHIVFK